MARLLMLDRMEIIGFKSFYGRTLFEFPNGITAVVGPNGCGKSNVGDAISWVLGEQRASSLRSDRMEDVIFNGSEARRPLGMAEVSLRFKNLGVPPGRNGHDGGDRGAYHEGNGHGRPRQDAVGSEVAVPIPEVLELGIDEAETAPAEEPGGPRFLIEEIPEEVVVRRRLYRSGESEYSLNGERCRLKDIQALLARTQIGTRLYTTIEQGKIDQILTSKPKDRRAIIEEAAGILGFKAKRRQAEQKLEAAQANLLRLSDIASEVEKQINSLKRQAAKARRYRRLMETLRERRLAISRRRLLALDAERRAVVEALAALRDREAEAAAGLAGGDADLEALRVRLEEGEAASRARREQIHALDIAIDRTQAGLRAGEDQTRELAGRIEEAGRAIESLEARAAEQQERLAALDAGIAAAETRRVSAREVLGRVESLRQERQRAIEEREAFLAERRAGLLRLLDEQSEIGRARATLAEQARVAAAALERVEGEAAGSRLERERLTGLVADLGRGAERARLGREERERERQALVDAERRADERLLVLERRSEELKGREAALGERLAALREMERQRAGFAEGVKEILGGAVEILPGGVVGEKLQVPRGLERAVAAVLEGLLDAVLVHDPVAALRGVDHLRRRAAGRVAFAPGGRSAGTEGAGSIGTDRGPALPAGLMGRSDALGLLGERVGGLDECGAAGALLMRAVLVPSLAAGIDLAAACPGWIYVTAAGDVVRADGVIVGGEGPALQHGLLARRAEMEEIAEQIAAVAGARQRAEGDLPRARRELDEVRTRLQSCVAALQEAERAALAAGLLGARRGEEMQAIETRLPALVSESERLTRTIAGQRAEDERLAAALEAAGARRRFIDEAIASASDDLAGRRGDLDRARAEELEARSEVAAGEERQTALRREGQAIEESIQEIGARASQRAAERADWAARVVSLREQAGDLARDLERALAGRAGETAREEAAAAGLAYDRSLLHAREQSAKELRAAHETVRRETQERELSRERLDSDLRHLEAICRDDLGVSLESLRTAPATEGEAPAALEMAEAEIDRLKAELEGIGPVNLMAIEQHSELQERYDFLIAQRTDLESSIASLRETIRRINRTSRERFMAAFQAIQDGFQACFAALFGGGRAELRLQEDEEDVLEAGIEIAAQPPGKRLQSIALLSGGEKALTAVALLFSLFRYRPSPFCVLDEVDAPLDEANVERFTRLLQELRAETQFIVITHNRKSMEAADLLYGITMEEPGISKVLPLRFE